MTQGQAWGIKVLRVVVGIVFVMHGGQKLFICGVSGVAGFLGRVGIPLPLLSALVVTGVEFLGGAALLLGQTIFACPIYQNYGKAIAQRRYKPAGFKLSLGLKDVDLVLQMAASTTVPMPLASMLHDRFLAALARGRGELDWAAIALGVSDDAGLSRELPPHLGVSERDPRA